MECTLKSQIEHKTDEYNALKREHDKCLVEQQSRSEGQRFEDTERMLNDQINLLKVSSNKTKTEMHRMQNRANVLEQKLQSKEAEFDSLHSKYEALKDSFRTKAVQYSGVLREFNEYIEQNNEDRETADGRITSLREEVAELKAMQKSTSSSTNRRRRKPKPFARKKKRHSDWLNKIRSERNVPVIVCDEMEPTTTTAGPDVDDEYFEDDDCDDVPSALSDDAEEESPHRLHVVITPPDDDEEEDERICCEASKRPQSTRHRKRKPKLRSHRKRKSVQSTCSAVSSGEGLPMSISSEAGTHTDCDNV